MQIFTLKSYGFSPQQIKDLSLSWCSYCCFTSNTQKDDLLQFHLDQSTDKSTSWQDVGETPDVGQMVWGHWKSAGRFIVSENLGRTHWRRKPGASREESLHKVGFYHIHASYTYELWYYLLAWPFNNTSQIKHLITKHIAGNTMKS